MNSSGFESAEHLTDKWRSEYLDKLLAWFEQHKRDLPWRRTRDPYAIWISESMLQQTQVATVIDYYNRFLARFPDVTSLAAGTEQEVMSMWAGLGYYRRARQLHAAAQLIVSEHRGTFPNQLDHILDLPGVGRYTAGAIASIALGQAAPIVEANTQRLYARLLKLDKPLHEPAAQTKLWQFAQWQLDGTRGSGKSSKKRDPGSINQAVMELGALVCKPVSPLCLVCPLVDLCPTAAAGLQARIPAPKPKREFTNLHHVALMVQHRERWLLRCNPAGGWWHGLWDFPRVDATELGLRAGESSKTKTKTHQSITWPDQAKRKILQLAHRQLFEQSTLIAFTEIREPLLSLSHGVTRYRIQVDGLHALANPAVFESRSDWLWVDSSSAQRLPLTATAKKMLKKING